MIYFGESYSLKVYSLKVSQKLLKSIIEFIESSKI